MGFPRNDSMNALKKLFTRLPPPDRRMYRGFYRAQFIGPLWLRLLARPAVALGGLPGWQGKKFIGPESATNVLKTRKGPREAFQMQLVSGPSLVDQQPGVALCYVRPAPVSLRWVRDELRAYDEGTLLGMTVVDLPGLRCFAFPFLLERAYEQGE